MGWRGIYGVLLSGLPFCPQPEIRRIEAVASLHPPAFQSQSPLRLVPLNRIRILKVLRPARLSKQKVEPIGPCAAPQRWLYAPETALFRQEMVRAQTNTFPPTRSMIYNGISMGVNRQRAGNLPTDFWVGFAAGGR